MPAREGLRAHKSRLALGSAVYRILVVVKTSSYRERPRIAAAYDAACGSKV